MIEFMDWVRSEGGAFGPFLATLVATLIAVVVALILHRMLLAALTRAVRRSASPADEIIVEHGRRPMKWVLIVTAIGLAQRAAPPEAWVSGIWRQAVGFLFPALIGWLAVELVGAVLRIVELRADISVEDNLAARRRRTRAAILARIAVVLIIFLTVCMMLVSIPGVRSVGVTLMASAGVAGLAVAAAAQPALKNLIAGVQMAFTEPIRIDDVVIIAGEWGRVEDIRLTYVVVKIWDERRLVVPVSKFLEEPFQNWTMQSARLLGSAFVYVDPTADVGRLRAKAEEIVKGSALWDGRFVNLQVTDLKSDVMELRVLATAADASRAFDLRCEIRETLMAYISSELPEALPKRRLEPSTDALSALADRAPRSSAPVRPN